MGLTFYISYPDSREKNELCESYGHLKKYKMAAKNIQIDNICKTINIFDTHKEQKLFFIKKYTFPQNFIKIKQIITKLCPLENMQKVKKCVFSRFFRDSFFQ